MKVNDPFGFVKAIQVPKDKKTTRKTTLKRRIKYQVQTTRREGAGWINIGKGNNVPRFFKTKKTASQFIRKWKGDISPMRIIKRELK